MTDNLTSIMRQRGNVVALFVVCGTAVAVPVGALAGVEAWAARSQP